ncbi:MAG: (d)CMP kinase [Bacteroidota bacterium]|nr:(d)CMP kinase [Bacteroidota bacterium]MEC7618224.1 (d)CMP kinase [Bacteroidota bacterium]MEC7813254.1 (d)CMP kinase [Bacteroidota bacterium]MEC7945432.1 (d)CMP kinase [Bacteroidota bacterium]MEC8407057.1 (d)CMP kinase [Bacteroidota bacterium]|tara:strand:- start:385 stop:1071 length:687 start_codon:yes stop_codon:yes gene_type:complete
MKNYIISIDGHSGCGKSTLAKKLALELRYTYVDTGAMYRAVALFALQNGLIDEKGKLKADAINEVEKLVIDFTEPNEQGESYIQLNGLVVEKEIRSIEVSDRVSEVSKHEFIRRKLVLIQQKFGKEQNIVMDGRDIGTVVFPNADIKFWIKASAQKRAERRWEEYKSKGEYVEFQKVLDNIISRDKQDSNREVSPLKKPKGAIEIDTSNINIEQTCDLALSYVKKLLP